MTSSDRGPAPHPGGRGARRSSRLSAIVRCGAAAVLALLSTACNAYGVPLVDAADEINASWPDSNVRIREGDRLEIRYPFKPEWSQTVAVRGDGTVSLVGLGEITVGGLSIADLQSLIAKSTVQTPGAEGAIVNVMWGDREIETSRTVYVVGEVRTPGPIRFQTRNIDLLEAISTAGGHLKATANLGNVFLVRTLPSGERLSWHLDAREEFWIAPEIQMREGDVLFVPNTAIDDVNIWVDQNIRRMLPAPYLIPTF